MPLLNSACQSHYTTCMTSSTTKRVLAFYWLLLLAPAIVIGVAAYQLLTHEKTRLHDQAQAAYLDRSQVLAESIRLTVLSVQEALSGTLTDLPDATLEESLNDWRNTNPLIRNVFIWSPVNGLQYPHPSSPSSSEEARFIQRYDALFSGRLAWADKAGEEAAVSATPGSPLAGTSRFDLVREVQSLKAGARKLADLAKKPPAEKNLGSSAAQLAADSCGWRPWFMENRLYMIGWSRKAADNTIFGVELEMMTLLSRLVANFPETAPPGLIYTLNDGSGRIQHQSSGPALADGAKPRFTVSLAPQLPHWEIGVHVVDDTPAEHAARNFLLFAGLLLAILIVAMLAGGGLLTRQAVQQARDARRKTTFVSNVSHELKTPLTSIRMYAELLLTGRVQDEEKKEKYLEVIVDESQRLARLVNNVLDFSRLEQGRKKYYLETIDLAELVNHFFETQRLRLEKEGLTVQKSIPAKECPVTADRDSLEQVLLNLVDNAVKYAADGKEIRFDLDRSGDCCRLRIMDRGSGVPSAHRRKIFEKFHRVDDSLTTRQPGTGLGLSISRKILQDLGGDLVYEDRQGGGSCFEVTLPRKAGKKTN
jgi:signal transduction histidine kinase